MAKKIGKKITNPKEVDMFLNLKSKDSTTSFIMENFASFDFEPPKYYTFDIIHIPKGAFTNGEYQNDEEFDTTIGSWIFNKFFIEVDLIGVIGYDDRPVTSKHFDDLVAEGWFISKYLHTSYQEALKINIVEKRTLLNLITRELKAQKEAIDKIKGPVKSKV